MPRQIHPIIDFRGGQNDSVTPDSMLDNELMIADNIELSIMGGFTYRPGTEKFNANAYGSGTSNRVNQLIEFPTPDGTIKLIAVIGDGVFDITDGQMHTLLQMGPGGNYTIGYFIFNSRFYFVADGKYYVYGDYRYTTASGTQTIKKGDIVKNEPISTHTTDPGIEDRFYKAQSDLGSVNLASADFANTTKWLDVTDGSIPFDVREVVANSDATNSLKPIKRCKYFLFHTKSLRIFAAGDYNGQQALYYSEPSDPTFFKKTSIVFPNTSEGVITGLTQLLDTVLVGYSHAWWGWTGIDPKTDATWGKYSIPHGLVNNNTIALTPNSFTFLSHDGIYRVSSGILSRDLVMLAGEEMIKKITDKKVDKIIKSIKNPSKVTACFRSGKYYLAYSDVSANSDNNCVLVYDWYGQNFVRYTGWTVHDFAVMPDNRFYFASNRFVLKVSDTALNDIDVETTTGQIKPIHLHVETKPYNFKNPIVEKIIHRFFLWSSQDVGAGSTLRVTLRIDYALQSFDIDLNNELFIWGEAWGKVWGSVVDMAPQEVRIHKKGIRCRVAFDANEILSRNSVVMYGMAFEIEPLKAKVRSVVI